MYKNARWLLRLLGLLFCFIGHGVHAVPLFGSLKADRVNVRCGPGRQYQVEWVYSCRGWPVQILESFENWRKIKDYDGVGGWVGQHMISQERTVLVIQETLLHKNNEAPFYPLARLKKNVVGKRKKCLGSWCLISVSFGKTSLKGWVARSHVWDGE